MVFAYLLLLLGAALVPFFIHLLLSRLSRLFKEPAHRQKIVLVSSLIGLVPVAVMFLIWVILFRSRLEGGALGPGIYLFGIYSLFAYSYFHIFNMSETARRVRILMDGTAGRDFDPENIGAQYTGEHMVSIRLRRLVSLRELNKNGNRYLPGRGLLLLPARIIPFLHRVLFPEKSPASDLSVNRKRG